MNELDVEQSLAPYVTADVNESVADTLTKLRNAKKHFILVTKKWNEEDLPVSVVREPALMSLAAQKNQKLDQLLEQFPPMLTVKQSELGNEDLCDILTILGETHSPGLVIRLQDDSFGIVSRASVARAVTLEDIALVGRVRGTFGTIGVPVRTYVCRQCVPASRKRTRVGGPPDCDVWSHGPMEED